MAQARQMLVRRQVRCKDQPLRVHPCCGRVPAQLVRALGRALVQPQHAAWDGLQDAHPAGKHVGKDFVGVVEAHVDESRFGQPKLTARKNIFGDAALAVVALVAVRHAHHFFGEVRLVLGRNHRGVGNDVVHAGAAQCAGVAQVTDLHGRAALCKQLLAAVLRVALQVDGDVQLQLPRLRSNAVDAPVLHVQELIEAGRDAIGHCVALYRSEGKAVDLEAVVIVRGQHLGHEHAGGVVVKVGREVADAQLLAARWCNAALARGIALGATRIGPSDRMHEGGIIGNRQKEEGYVNPLAFAHIAQQLSYRTLDVLPIRDHQLGIHALRQGGRCFNGAKRKGLYRCSVGLGLNQRLGLQQKYLVLIPSHPKKPVEVERRGSVIAQ